ncbi:polysaccharide deacetylase family protein [Deinococcus sp.]|uniref:polysaccharide deacetylase family protein n=1 Tax=Deinococcus sp. TaxID=47478 RepID=UPI0025BB0DCB|nr:polysaccharide deacetylase family protein [Deinococcus sp.]
MARANKALLLFFALNLGTLSSGQVADQTQPVAVPASVPGQVQPVAPGTRAARAVPTLTLSPGIPQVRQVQYLGNGFIEVAHAIVTVNPAERMKLRVLAQQVVAATFAARPRLNEVDLSIYPAETYAGFGGRLPLMTASVPRSRVQDFGLWITDRVPYDRVWVNPGHLPAYEAPDRVREAIPKVTLGHETSLENQARREGGLLGGLLFHSKNANSPIAALTFDDAPHPMYEPLLLDLLRRAGVRATFFVIGRNAAPYPYFIRDMTESGNEVGNHTYHHLRLPPLSSVKMLGEIQQANAAIERITGEPVKYFRPPGGEYNTQVLAAARALGLTTVFWTDDPGDFQNPGEALLESRLRTKLRPGGIVLLHDNASEMLSILQGFLRAARYRGFTLTTVGGLPKY